MGELVRLQSLPAGETDDLWRAYGGDLLRLATLLVGPNDADDIAAEAFLGACRSATRPNVVDSRSYLLGAVANHAASFRRSRERRWRRDLAAAPERSETPLTLRVAAAPPGRRRLAPRTVAVASGLTAAAGLVGVVVVAGRDADAPTAATAPIAPTATSAVDTTPASPTGNPGYQPTVLPDDLSITHVTRAFTLEDARERPSSGTAWIILGRRDESGAVADKIDVSVDYGRTFSPMPGAGYTREAITIAGVPGEIVRSANSDQVIVEYQWGEQAVMVTANAGDDIEMLDDMIQIANSVSVDEATAELTGPLPAGYEILTSGPWQAEADNTEPTTLYYSDPRNVRSISVSFEMNPPADFQYWFMGDDLTETTLRGRQAFLTTGPSVIWLERPDLMITVSGTDGITLDEVLATAESLQPMTDAHWDELQAAALDSGTHDATTTAVGTVATSVAPTTTESD